MANNSSAGVYTRELDLSQRIAAASTSIGVIVGGSSKGPIMQRTLITSVRQFIEVFGAPNPRISYMHYAALAFLEESKRLYVTRVASEDCLTAGAYLTVDDLSSLTPVLRLNNFDDGSNQPKGKYDPFNTLEFDPVAPGIQNILGFFTAANPGAWNNSIYVRVRPSTKAGVALPDDPYEFYVDVFLDYKSPRQAPAESFLVSRDMRVDGFNRQMNIEEVINRRSRLIRFRNNPYAPVAVKILTTAAEFLDGAEDGTNPTSGLINQGWELYRDPEYVDINILINGGYTDVAVQLKMDDICRDRMDCIAVLDMPYDLQDVQDAVVHRRETMNLDSSYSAIYTPDLLIYDERSDRELFVPPSGHAAAAYARTDYDFETWFAPAGMDRGNLKILGVRNVYNQGDRDALNDAQINMIRVIPGKGYKIWGADTMQTMASALSNVNVRRLLNFIEKSVSIACLYSVFDPNDKILWAKLVELCERFLKPIKGGRGLYRFQVVCDESNNTPETIANGDCILDVFLDPVIPAKRIHLNAIITKTGAVYKEAAAARQS